MLHRHQEAQAQSAYIRDVIPDLPEYKVERAMARGLFDNAFERRPSCSPTGWRRSSVLPGPVRATSAGSSGECRPPPGGAAVILAVAQALLLVVGTVVLFVLQRGQDRTLAVTFLLFAATIVTNVDPLYRWVDPLFGGFNLVTVVSDCLMVAGTSTLLWASRRPSGSVGAGCGPRSSWCSRWCSSSS